MARAKKTVADPPTPAVVEEAPPPVHPDVHQSVVALNERMKKAMSANKNWTVRHLLEEMGIEPARELIKMAQQETPDGSLLLSIDQRIKVWTELLQYQQPKLKSVEHSGKVDQEITIIVKKFDVPDEPRQAVIVGSDRTLDSRPVLEVTNGSR